MPGWDCPLPSPKQRRAVHDPCCAGTPESRPEPAAVHSGMAAGTGRTVFLGGQGFSAISLRRKGGTVMQKTYVLDTNVLIQSPEALEAFEDNHIVLPLAVLEELDGLKNAEGEKGRSARQVIRFLEELRSQGSLVEGVSLPGGGHPAAGGQPCGGTPAPTAWTLPAGTTAFSRYAGGCGRTEPRRCW